MLEVEHLSFQYSHQPILRDVSFTAQPGQITAVIGANGVGKSTMLKCVAGLEDAQGVIRIGGKRNTDMTPEERAASLGYLCQNNGCAADLNVFEVVLTGLVHQLSYHVTQEQLDRVKNILDLMGMTPYAERKISQLSGGQQQLVFIAQTLIKQPHVLILDEPTSALDMNRQFHLMELLRKVTGKHNFTTLVCLHQLDLVARYADKVIVLKDGGVYCEDTPENALTEQMFREVCGVQVEFFRDQQGVRHAVPVGRA